MTRSPAKRPGKAKLDPERALSQRIQRGAVAHYEDPQYYDHTYKRRRNDVRFYVELAQERRGPVLELGVGTGRVALALARAGVETVGVEPVPQMLAQAREKLSHLPRAAQGSLSLRAGDARKVRLKRRFPLVFAPFNVFMHLYSREDLEQAFTTVRAHLAPKGRFVFDVLMPDLRAMVRNPGKLYRGPHLTDPKSGHKYEYFEAFEYQATRQVQLVSMVFQNMAQLDDLKVIPLSQRQFFPQELEALLHYNGFVIEHLWGDFARGPLTGESESQVIVARAR
jgi:SAM-dependent methyltransferase